MKTCYWLRRSPSREGEGPCERTNRNMAIICEHVLILPKVMQDDGSTQVKNTSKHCPKTNYSLCRMLIICNTLLPFKRHSRNAFGVHEGFIVYTCNQTATSVVNQRKVARMHMYWKKNTLVGSYKKIIIVRSW